METQVHKRLTRKEKVALDKQNSNAVKLPKKSLKRKEQKLLNRLKTVQAVLRDYPSSPRKMRYVADLIRGLTVEKALIQLKLSTKWAAIPMRKLLLSAISNWQEKKGQNIDYSAVYVKSVFVDGGTMLKRVQPAPQGRAYRKRKRSNHVTIILDSLDNQQNS